MTAVGRFLGFSNYFFFPHQDKSVAFKIFELGLKKYGDIPEYILAYIDYLSHLNGRLRVVKCRDDVQRVERYLDQHHND